jgi:ribose 5-phosphate isomerase B
MHKVTVNNRCNDSLRIEPVIPMQSARVENNLITFVFNPFNVYNMQKYRIALGCDHAGFDYKEEVKKLLSEQGFPVKDFGTFSKDSVDYPDFVHPVADSIETKQNDFGILICGSANGVAITANKHQQIRAAIAWKNDLAALARQHNDANILCIPSRFVSVDEANQFVMTFLSSAFEGGRHANRVSKIAIHS